MMVFSSCIHFMRRLLCTQPLSLHIHVCMCVLKAGGKGGQILPIWYALHHSLVCIMSGGPCDAAARRAGGKEERGGVAPSPRAHRIHFSQRAGCWREGTREREKERESEGKTGGREGKESVCVRVSCVCAWIAPPHPVHRFCRRPCSDGENKTDNPFFFLRFFHRRVIPDVTDKSFYVACIESCAVHLGETVTPWLWLWNL